MNSQWTTTYDTEEMRDVPLNPGQKHPITKWLGRHFSLFRPAGDDPCGPLLIERRLRRMRSAVRRSSRKIVGILACVVMLSLVGYFLVHGNARSGVFRTVHRHNDPYQTYEEYIPQTTMLSGMQAASMRLARPFRGVLGEELQEGHVDLKLPWHAPERTFIVELEKLFAAMQTQCAEQESCVCVSAAHLGVPLQVFFVRGRGVLVNPAIEKYHETAAPVLYRSPLNEYHEVSASAMRVEFTNTHGYKERASLGGAESVCLFMAVQESNGNLRA